MKAEKQIRKSFPATIQLNSPIAKSNNRSEKPYFVDNRSLASLQKQQSENYSTKVPSIVQRIPSDDIGDAAYKQDAKAKLKFEREIGIYLIENPELTNIATKIKDETQSPSFDKITDQKVKDNVARDSGKIGGASELIANEPTLDAAVLATHLNLNNEKNNIIKDVRPNRFNKSHAGNPIKGWNDHHFDMDLFKIELWAKLPAEIKEKIKEKKSLTDEQLETEYNDLGNNNKRKEYLEKLHIFYSTDTYIEDEKNHANPLGPTYRSHVTGYYSNVVNKESTDDPTIGEWVTNTVENKKPIISGPSGHTLRYLNFWAETRAASKKKAEIPSLEEARLVMMGNLMPPKMHHSYHEIMSASIGVEDGDASLGYKHPDSYDDLKESSSPIGQAALVAANAKSSQETQVTTAPHPTEE